MSDETEREWRRYVEGMPGVLRATMTDAEFRLQMQQLRRLLATVELALDVEGIAPDVRLRVVRMVLFGAPDPAAAQERIDRVRRVSELLAGPPRAFGSGGRIGGLSPQERQ